MLTNYIEQFFQFDNYFDGLLVTDSRGYIECFLSYRPDLSGAKPEELIGKQVLDVYPSLTAETSTIMRVLKTGEPIYNASQTLVTKKGKIFHAINTTLPIWDGGTGKIIGTVDVSRYMDRFYEKQGISVHLPQEKKDSFYHIEDIITEHQGLNEIKRKIPLIARTNSSVLITGESGTGKELIAQAIHTASSRKQPRFISQNCAAIPATLLESILFGTAKGSYTGAENRPGLFEIANGGTLFLDEVNSMDISVQPKLLRAIEEKKVSRLGTYRPVDVDVKIIAAMNVDPQRCIAEGTLREDLYYRLSVVRVDLPTLRERRCDIPLLTDYFVSRFNCSMKRDISEVDDAVRVTFAEYPWPGNVRELKNVIEGAFNVTQGRCIRRGDLAEYITGGEGGESPPARPLSPEESWLSAGGAPLDQYMEQVERGIIERTVQDAASYAQAARRLGLSRQALMYKLKKYHIGG